MSRRCWTRLTLERTVQMESTSRPPKFDHDEPIIADNSPARFNFSKELDEDGTGGKNFKRDFTGFSELTLTVVDRMGNVTTTKHSLKPEGKILFDLSSSSNGQKKEQISLTA